MRSDEQGWFLRSQHKEVVDLYEALLKSAAEHKILVNFHGSNKPTGESRTCRTKWSYQQLGDWPPEILFSSIRLAAFKYGDKPIKDLRSKIPEPDVDDRINLLRPKSPS